MAKYIVRSAILSSSFPDGIAQPGTIVEEHDFGKLGFDKDRLVSMKVLEEYTEPEPEIAPSAEEIPAGQEESESGGTTGADVATSSAKEKVEEAPTYIDVAEEPKITKRNK